VLAVCLRERRWPRWTLPESVAWVGRWKFTKGWTKVRSYVRHADELPGARRLASNSIEGESSQLNSGVRRRVLWTYIKSRSVPTAAV
jgi:hypothetical protein